MRVLRAVSLVAWMVAALAGVAGPVFAGLALGLDDVALSALQGLLGLVYASVGARITIRSPRNAVGWILLAVGFCQATSGGTYPYGLWAGEVAAPLAAEALWVGNWIWAPSLALLVTLLLLLFPDGRPLTPRWRPVVWVAGLAVTTVTVTMAVGLWPLRQAVLANPDADGVMSAPLETLLAVSGAVVLVSAILSLVSLVLRFRRSRGLERVQMKWFAFGGSVTAAGVAVTFGPWPEQPVVFVVWLAVLCVLFGAVPVVVGVAVLRHRLYEIDRVVSRTLAYAVVTGILVAVYSLVVLVVGSVGPGNSDLTVAGSTLLVAALFQPVRRRVQAIVDRRFNRPRHDALLVVESFARGLRGEVDLDALTAELRAVAATVTEPRSVSLWLRTD